MAEMLNLSRLYNAIASSAIVTRASLEAESYARGRIAFGKPVAQHSLAADMLAALRAERAGALALTFEGVHALDRADDSERRGKPDEEARRFVRGITPLTKLFTAKVAVACASEAMEMQGGNGYIETSPLPRLLRDAQVLPIWEGTTSVLVLDMVRAARVERAHEAVLARARAALEASTLGELAPARDRVSARLARVEAELGELARSGGEVPASARATAEGLARAVQASLLLEAAETEGAGSEEAEAALRLSALERAPAIH
jgi:hypothetical protein